MNKAKTGHRPIGRDPIEPAIVCAPYNVEKLRDMMVRWGAPVPRLLLVKAERRNTIHIRLNCWDHGGVCCHNGHMDGRPAYVALSPEEFVRQLGKLNAALCRVCLCGILYWLT